MFSRGGLVLLDDAGGDVAAAAERDTLVFRPGPDVRAALPAGGSAPRLVLLPAASPAGVFEVGATCWRNAAALVAFRSICRRCRRRRTALSHLLGRHQDRLQG
jgi:hypothetical protein